jgi:hypothetical protein
MPTKTPSSIRLNTAHSSPLEFSRTIERIFQLPPPIVPKMSLYLRGYFNDILMQSLEDTRRRVMREPQA